MNSPHTAIPLGFRWRVGLLNSQEPGVVQEAAPHPCLQRFAHVPNKSAPCSFPFSVPDRGQNQELACSTESSRKLYPGKARFAVAHWLYQAGTSYAPSAQVCVCAHLLLYLSPLREPSTWHLINPPQPRMCTAPEAISF